MLVYPATDVVYLGWAARLASTQSHDRRTQNGCVIARGEEMLTFGVNHYPVMSWLHDARSAGEGKYTYIEHAERAAVYQAAAHGKRLDGATLYAVWAACPECARAIIMAGIDRVVCLLQPRLQTPSRWIEPIRAADEMLADAGVQLELVAPELGVKIIFDGQEMRL